MNEFGLKRSISDNFMIHVLNNVSKECDVILDELENHFTLSGDDASMIAAIRKN